MKSFILSTLLMRLAFGLEREDVPPGEYAVDILNRERGVDSNLNCEALGCNYYPQQGITKLIKCTEDGSQLSVIFNGDNGCSDWNEYKDIESMNNGCCRKGAMKPELEDGRKQESLIVGGTSVTANNFKFIAWFHTEPHGSCTASIIRKEYPTIILTAAHCMFHDDKSPVNIGSAETYLLLKADRQHDPNAIKSSVIFSVVHPQYDQHTHHGHDIALLWLQDSDIPKDTELSAVTLNQVSSGSECCNNGDYLRVIGYGISGTGKQPTSTLEYADVNYIPRAVCNSNTYKYGDGYVKQSMFCAAAPNKDHCDGDSGGPLLRYYSNGAYDQVGVVSGSGGDCADPNFPGYYADVGVLYPWIQCYFKSDWNCNWTQ